jgi:hypothetical protein
MIILTAAQADQVRGLTVKGHALAPVPLADGTLALPEACINDATHLRFKSFLQTLPTVRDSTIQYSDWSQDTLKRAANTYSSTWLEGELVVTRTG